jgi:predicted RNA-binding Zn-ribbon protein involved in translation (DUF1610 family)
MGQTNMRDATIKPETDTQRRNRENRGYSVWLRCPKCGGRAVRRDRIVGETWSAARLCLSCGESVHNGELGLLRVSE